MVIFHSYVSLPEGNLWRSKHILLETVLKNHRILGYPDNGQTQTCGDNVSVTELWALGKVS